MAIFTYIATTLVLSKLATAIFVAVGTFATSMVVGRIIAKRAMRKAMAGGEGGGRVQLPPATDNKLPVIYGSAFIGGAVIDAYLTPDQKTMWYVIALAEKTDDGTISFGTIYYDGKLVSLSGVNVTELTTNTTPAQIDTRVANKIQMYFYNDGSNSGTNTFIPAYTVFPKWAQAPTPTDYAMTNTAFVVVKVIFDQNAGTTNLGALTVQLINTEDAKIPGSGEYRPGTAIQDYLMNDRYGCAIPIDRIDTASLVALNTYSDELIDYTPVGGGSAQQARYRVNGPLDTADNCLNNLQNLVDTCDSWIQYSELTGQWKVVINKLYPGYPDISNLFVVDSSNLVGGIQISPIDLNETFNEVEVAYPNNNIKDQTDYQVIDLASIDTSVMSPNEAINRLNLTFGLVNNAVQAKYLGIRRLLQSREDLVISCELDYSGIQIEAGDVIRVTHPVYGWVDKLFRVSQVNEEKKADGTLGASIVAFEYNNTVYADDPVQDYVPAFNTGLLDPNVITTPGTPDANNNPDASGIISSFKITAAVPESGSVMYMDFNYGNSSNVLQHILYRTLQPADGIPFTNSGNIPGNISINNVSIDVNDLVAGTYYFSVTARNDFTGTVGNSSTSFVWPGAGINQANILDANAVFSSGNILTSNNAIPNLAVNANVYLVSGTGQLANNTYVVSINSTTPTANFVVSPTPLVALANAEIQVITGGINGNAIVPNTMPGNRVTPNTLPGNTVIANTLPGNTIIANTVNGNVLVNASVNGNVLVNNSVNGNVLVNNSVNGNVLINASVNGNVLVNGSVNGNVLVNGSVSGNVLIADTVNGNVIKANTINGNTIIANTIGANIIQGNSIWANTLFGNRIVANTLNGNTIIANTLNGNSIEVDTLNGNVIKANTLNGNSIIANTIGANIINGDSIIANTLSGNRIQANTLNGNTIIANTINGNSIEVDTLNGNRIKANTLNGNTIIANTIGANIINGDSIIANTLSGNRIQANTLNGNTIIANTINGNSIEVDTLNGDRIKANTLNGNTIIANTIGANRIQGDSIWANTLNGDRIIANTLDGNTIIAGTVTGIVIAANTLNGNTIIANTLNGNTIQANTIGANIILGNSIWANTLFGNRIIANTLNGNTVIAGTLNGNSITAQTMNGNVILANTLNGNSIIANTIGANIIEGNSIWANTLFGNRIVANSLNGNTIIANTIGANTIQGNSIVANTLFGNRIVANTLDGNTVIAGTLNGNSIIANTIGANTIQGSSIVANTLNGNTVIANTLNGNSIQAFSINGGVAFVAGTIQAESIAANTITFENLAIGAVTQSKSTISDPIVQPVPFTNVPNTWPNNTRCIVPSGGVTIIPSTDPGSSANTEYTEGSRIQVSWSVKLYVDPGNVANASQNWDQYNLVEIWKSGASSVFDRGVNIIRQLYDLSGNATSASYQQLTAYGYDPGGLDLTSVDGGNSWTTVNGNSTNKTVTGGYSFSTTVANSLPRSSFGTQICGPYQARDYTNDGGLAFCGTGTRVSNSFGQGNELVWLSKTPGFTNNGLGYRTVSGGNVTTGYQNSLLSCEFSPDTGGNGFPYRASDLAGNANTAAGFIVTGTNGDIFYGNSIRTGLTASGDSGIGYNPRLNRENIPNLFKDIYASYSNPIGPNTNTYTAVVVGQDGTVARSERTISASDFANSWTAKSLYVQGDNTQPLLTDLYAVAGDNTDNNPATSVWVAVGQYGMIQVSTDDGDNWDQVFLGNSITCDFNGVRYGNGKWVAVGDGGNIYVSSNAANANSWTQISTANLNYTNGTNYGSIYGNSNNSRQLNTVNYNGEWDTWSIGGQGIILYSNTSANSFTVAYEQAASEVYDLTRVTYYGSWPNVANVSRPPAEQRVLNGQIISGSILDSSYVAGQETTYYLVIGNMNGNTILAGQIFLQVQEIKR